MLCRDNSTALRVRKPLVWRATQVLYTMVCALVLSVGLALPADAGSNGQQLVFYRYSNVSSITYLKVEGTNQAGRRTTWTRSFSPGAPNPSIDGWWWKGRTRVEWRMANGRTGSCLFDVPVNQSGNNWKQVGVDRQPGNSCWFS
jgi:hypothetical protein